MTTNNTHDGFQTQSVLEAQVAAKIAESEGLRGMYPSACIVLARSNTELLEALRQCAAAMRQCNHVEGVTEQAIWAADAAISQATGNAA